MEKKKNKMDFETAITSVFSENENKLDIANKIFDFLRGFPYQDKKDSELPLFSPNLSTDQAWDIIYFLQTSVHILPDTIERCDDCGKLFDSEAEGGVSDDGEHIYCETCINNHVTIDDNGEETIN
mgnify:CR=1 FL=1